MTGGRGPRLLHVTTTDMSLALLLGPQLMAFREAGYEVIGVSAPGPYVEDVRSLGVRHIALRHATRAMAPHRDALALLELTRLFRRLRPAIVHTHNPKPGLYGRFAAALTRVPAVVNTVHGLYAVRSDPLPRRAIVYALERLAATCSSAELVQNVEDVDQLRRIGVPAERLHLLGNGIDLTRFDPDAVDPSIRRQVRHRLGVADGEIAVGFVGRLVWEKGLAELFAAADALRRSHPAVRCVVVGPTDEDKSDAVHAAAIAAARAGGVRILGYEPRVEDLYAALDMFILPSHREGFPRAAMEAAAMRLPVVASDIRGCRQVVDDGVTGLLVRVRDAHALSAAIAALTDCPERRDSMGRAGREKALREFDQTAVIGRTLEIYARLLDGRRR